MPKQSGPWLKTCVVFRSDYRQLQRLYLAGLTVDLLSPHQTWQTTNILQSLKRNAVKDQASLSSHALTHVCIPSSGAFIQRTLYQVLLQRFIYEREERRILKKIGLTALCDVSLHISITSTPSHFTHCCSNISLTYHKSTYVSQKLGSFCHPFLLYQRERVKGQKQCL